MPKSKVFILFLIVLFPFFVLQGQDSQRFAQEIDRMLSREGELPESPIIFTGSSSVRMWSSLASDFPDAPILNRGFGGSQMSDLLFYLDRLVINDRPRQVFIYEGDNDISAGKSPRRILKDFRKCYRQLRKALPDTDIVFISPKPSLARWELQAEYEKVNELLRKFSERKENVRFADVWTPMLDESGKPMADIFLKDDLHMNAKGYVIWKKVIGDFLIK